MQKRSFVFFSRKFAPLHDREWSENFRTFFAKINSTETCFVAATINCRKKLVDSLLWKFNIRSFMISQSIFLFRFFSEIFACSISIKFRIFSRNRWKGNFAKKAKIFAFFVRERNAKKYENYSARPFDLNLSPRFCLLDFEAFEREIFHQ